MPDFEDEQIPPNPELAARTTPPPDHGFQPEPTSFAELGDGLMKHIEARGLDKQPPPPPAPGTDPVVREMVRLVERGVPRKAARVIASPLSGGGDGGGDLLETEAMRIVMNFMAGAPGTLVLCGGVGTGKTVAAAWCVAQKTREIYVGPHPDGRTGTWPTDYQPKFRDVAKLARLPKYGKEAETALVPLEECALLVIDDAGKNGTADENISSLVVTRHDNGLRTILTTNLRWEDPTDEDEDSFVVRYGARVRDRVEESGKQAGGFFVIAEPSRRKGEPS